jgi:hypothetical protein
MQKKFARVRCSGDRHLRPPAKAIGIGILQCILLFTLLLAKALYLLKLSLTGRKTYYMESWHGQKKRLRILQVIW